MITFYSAPDLNDGFGSKIGRTNPHRGLDFPHPANTPVPVWAGGTVALIGSSSVLGTYVSVQIGPNEFAGYTHLKNVSVTVEQKLALGDVIATLSGVYDYHGSAWTGPHLHTTYGPRADSIYTGPVSDPWPHIQQHADSNANVSNSNTTPLNTGGKNMAFQITIQENGGLGRTLFIDNDIVTHVVHDDVVRINNYVGVPGGAGINQVSVSDARRLVEVRGFSWATVNALQPGQGLERSGRVVSAGAASW